LHAPSSWYDARQRYSNIILGLKHIRARAESERPRAFSTPGQGVIPKSGNRFSRRAMPEQKIWCVAHSFNRSTVDDGGSASGAIAVK
jgi:hypothetical protein